MPLPLATDSQGVAYLAYDSARDAVVIELFVDGVVTTATFTQTNATFFYVNNRSTAGYRKRALFYMNNTDKVLTINVNLGLLAGGNQYGTLSFTIPIGNATLQSGYVSSAGGFATNGTAPTKTAGDWSVLDAPAATGAYIFIQGVTTAATVGGSEIDFAQSA